MSTCCECKAFFPIPEDDPDYKAGKGDCVRERVDEKCKFWTSNPAMGDMDASACADFMPKK